MWRVHGTHCTHAQVVTAITQRHGHIYFQELGDPQLVKEFEMVMLNTMYSDVLGGMEDAAFADFIVDVYIAPPDDATPQVPLLEKSGNAPPKIT
jgi:hypothetical protein